MAEETYIEPKSSVEVSQNASGKFAYKVKIYFNDTGEGYEGLANNTKELFDFVKERFEG